MLLNDVFERFVQDSPVSVMVRGLLENTLSPRFLDELFANAAELQYTRTLLFSSVVDLMGLVVNRIQPAVNSAYHARAKTIGVSLKSVYNKLDNLETGISAAMVGTTAERLETVVTTMGGALPPLFIGIYYPGNQDPHKSLQRIRSSNSQSRLPRDQRSTTESTEIHGKGEVDSDSLFRVFQ